MIAYLGQTRSAKWIAKIEAANLGLREMTQPRERSPRRRPWAADNGAFVDWKAGRPFNAEAFASLCARAEASPASERPAFIVCPDRVAGGLASLAFSLDWLARHGSDYPGLRERWYLAVQDGMTVRDVGPVAGDFAGLFVGGTTEWKMDSAGEWCDLAHQLGKPCHVARMGTGRKAKIARSIGADSIDSVVPIMSEENFASFVDALVAPAPRRQAKFWDRVQ